MENFPALERRRRISKLHIFRNVKMNPEIEMSKEGEKNWLLLTININCVPQARPYNEASVNNTKRWKLQEEEEEKNRNLMRKIILEIIT